LTTPRPLLFFAVPVFLLLMLLAGFALALAREEKNSQQFVEHTYQVIVVTQAMLTDVQSAEIAERGYRMTGNAMYQDAIHMATARAEADLGHFQTLTADNPEQQVRATALAAELDEFEHLVPQGLSAPRTPAITMPNATRTLIVDIVSKTDRIRRLLSTAAADERSFLALRRLHTRSLERSTLILVLLSMFCALLTLVGAVVLLVWSNRRLARSEAVRTQQALMLQATLDNIRDGIAVFGRDGRLDAFNPQFFALADFPLSLAQYGAALEQFRKADAERREKILPPSSPLEGAEPQTRRAVLNDRHLDVYSAPIPDSGLLLAVADVTARVRSEEALRQSQKMEAVGQLTGGVAHDFNNLLQIIGSNLDLARDAASADGRVAMRLNNALAAVDRGSRLTGQLLAFARRQALNPRVINVGRLVQGITDLLRHTLGERVEVETVVDAGAWNTLADPNQLQNAILNLALNSRDAMPNGGKLTIEVSNAYLSEEYVSQQSDVAPGQYVLLAVTDTGFGMPSGIAARAFDPFFTTKPEGQGTGLGLSQVYGFVKQSGGHAKIYSEVGEGTTIKLYLPRTGRSLEEAAEPQEAALERGSETILVVEDDESVRTATADVLAALGYRVLSAAGAEQALEILRGGAKVDLIFSDVVMPGPLSTREMARLAREIDQDIKVLFTSGYTQNAIVHNGRLDDGVFLLSKPYRKQELARKLRQLLSSADAPKLTLAHGGDQTRKDARPRKALVVDDVALVRMTTVDIMEEIGIRVAEAATGAEALHLLAQDEDIDLLVTDLGLPGMSGAELIREAKASRPSLHVLVVSGYGREASLYNDIPTDATILAKPFTAEELRRAIFKG